MAITEFIVPGTPISSGASGRSRTHWKNAVSEAALAALPDKHALVADSVRVTIVYFYVSTDLDLDNIIKPILDALIGVIYVSDFQVANIEQERLFWKALHQRLSINLRQPQKRRETLFSLQLNL